MPSLSGKEIKESIKKNEVKLTLKFNSCLILVNDIEHVVRNATNTWKIIYNLHKKSDFFVNVSDKEDDGENEKEEENDDEEVTNYDNIDDEEQEQEATEEILPDIQSSKETNPKKIIEIVIASLPHSLRKELKTSSSEKATTKLYVSNTANPSTQTIFAPIELSTSLTKVTSTSSTKQLVLPPSSILVTQQ